MAGLKFELGDKVQFQKTDRFWGTLKGAKGDITDITRGSSGRIIYKVAYKHAVTGELKSAFFRSNELDIVEKNTFKQSERNNIQKHVEIGPVTDDKENKIKTSQVNTNQANMFEVGDSSSWDVFCSNFKGSLFKD